MFIAKPKSIEKIDYSGYPPRNVVVAGATGLVGREIIRLLEERPNANFTALVRRPGCLGDISGRVREVVFDYEDQVHYGKIGVDFPCDVFLCALGATIKKAGSPEAFRTVDLEYPSRLFGRLVQLSPRPMLGVVSSVGAGRPSGLYLKTKHGMEQRLLGSGLPHLIVRPSLILGEREDVRPLELVSAGLLKPYRALISMLAPRNEFLWRIAPIEAVKIASALVWICVDEPPFEESRILEGLALHHPIMR